MILAIDTETTGADWWHGCRPFFVSACDTDGNLHSWQWPVDPVTRQVGISRRDTIEIRDLIRSADRIVMHNAKFDIRMLSSFLSEPDIESIWSRLDDTLIAAHCLYNHWSHGLKHLAEVLLGMSSDDEATLQKVSNKARDIARRKLPSWRIANRYDPHFPGVKYLPGVGWWVMDTWLPGALYDYAYDTLVSALSNTPFTPDQFRDSLSRYAKQDAERTILLHETLLPGLVSEGLYPIYLDRLQLLPITYAMESRGVLLDNDRLDYQLRFHSTAIEQATICCREIADINLASGPQLRNQIYKHWGFPEISWTEKTNPQVDQATLTKLIDHACSPVTHRFLHNLILTKKHQKTYDYLDSYRRWTKDSVLHSQLNITGTNFTRQSSNNPNLQNVGTGKGDELHNLRTVFVPRPDHVFITIDYSNLELRIWAYSCGNEDLISAFEKGISIHLVIARELHPHLRDMEDEAAKATYEYKRTKNGNFALIYGAGESQADSTYGLAGIFDRMSSRFPEIRQFTRRLHTRFLRDGYITTLGGYRLTVPSDEPHKAVSAFVQGSAGDIIGQAMRDTSAHTGTLLLQIHDELVFEVPIPEAESLSDDLARIMTAVGPQFGIPIPVSVTIRPTSWGE